MIRGAKWASAPGAGFRRTRPAPDIGASAASLPWHLDGLARQPAILCIASLIMLCLWATAVSAQVVRVKSGEHDGFTRLVVNLPTAENWAFGRTLGGYELRLARPGPRYDLSTVFDLVTRDRLATIHADPLTGALQLGIGCACHAVAYSLRPDVIVIDIRPGPADQGSGFERAIDGSDGPALPALTTRPSTRPRARPAIRPPDADDGTPRAPYDWVAALRNDPDPPPTSFPADPDPRVLAAQQALLRQIARAAAQGVVEPSRSLLPENREVVAGIHAQPEGSNMGPVAQSRPDSGPAGHLRLPGSQPDAGPGLTGAGTACLEDDALAIGTWGSLEDFTGQLSALRSGLLGEFDRAEPSRVTALARFYLQAGFGAEARSLLSAFDRSTPDADLLLTIATIMDQSVPPPGHPFSGMEPCNSAAALWAVLGRAELRPGDRIATDAILQNFSGLPLHLRRHLGPGLADRFLGTGDQPTARAIRDAIARAPGDHGAGLSLTEARMDLAAGAVARGENRLRRIVAEGSGFAAEALLELAQSVLARGGTLDAPMLVTLAAFEREHRETAEGPKLRRALALATAAAGDFDDAFGRIAGGDTTLQAELWQLLAERGDTAALLDHGVGRAGAADPPLLPVLRRTLAERVLALGFPDEALRWLGAVQAPEDRLIAAQAALDLRDGRSVLRHLVGQDDTEAEALRAAALALLGETTGAVAAFRSAGLEDAASSELWRGQRWSEAVTDPAERWQAARTLLEPDQSGTGPVSVVDPAPGVPGIAEDAAPAVADLPPLAQARALIARGAATRTAIAALLDETAIPGRAAP